MHKHCLGLIVGVVGHGDGSRSDLTGHPSQKSVPSASGSLFRRKFVCTGECRYIRRLYRSREAPVRGQPGDISSIGIGIFAAHLVMEMSNV
jgi:hypothetical protein